MAWYRAGTVTVTNGSATVTGAGTDFVGNTQIGEVFLGPDGRVYEIAAVVSATQLTIIPVYQGATAGGQAYGLQPTASFARDLAVLAGQLLNGFGSVRDGIGQGLIGDGSAALPGIRFSADQDTGIYRASPNALGISAGGAPSLVARPGSVTMAGVVVIENPELPYITMNRTGIAGWSLGGYQANSSNWGLRLNDGAPALVVDTGGNLLVGVTSGSRHILSKGNVQGTGVLDIVKACSVFVGDNVSFSQAPAAFWIAADTRTGRSINAAGTLNASGADYAEYMTKAAGCGTIAPGDVCGVDKDGHLTRTWADAISFVVKSTDPAYVGGDTWARKMPPKPDKPGDALKAWEAALEAERVKVDRIAFCGQVPVNVTGSYAVGNYLIAEPNGSGGIKAVAVTKLLMTFEQYQRRIGKVWAVRDGRAWVDVQHG